MDIDINNLPDEITTDVYLLLSEHGYVTMHTDVMDCYTTLGEPVQVTFKLKGREDITSEIVTKLNKEAASIRADAEIKCQRIEDKIQSLLALPEKVGEA